MVDREFGALIAIDEVAVCGVPRRAGRRGSEVVCRVADSESGVGGAVGLI